MAIASKSTGKTEDPKAQIRRLRQEVEALTADRVSPVVADLTAKAQRTLTDTTTVMRGQTQVVSDLLRQNPLASVAVGVAVGFLLSRMFRR